MRCALHAIFADHSHSNSNMQFLEGMRTMRSDAVATVKRHGEEIFGLPGVNFKLAKVRRENTTIKALFEDNKFLTSMSPVDKIRPLHTLGQAGPSHRQQKKPSGLTNGYLYHPCILCVCSSCHRLHCLPNILNTGNASVSLWSERNQFVGRP